MDNAFFFCLCNFFGLFFVFCVFFASVYEDIFVVFNAFWNNFEKEGSSF
jgi:hypothetical protein